MTPPDSLHVFYLLKHEWEREGTFTGLLARMRSLWATSGALLVGMLFGMSQALSPTPPWNVRLNAGGTNLEFEYQNPRVP